MVRIIIFFLGIHNLLECGARVYIELQPVQNNRDVFSSITVYGNDGLCHTLPYDEINGNPFWRSGWSKAYFYDSRDTLLGSYRAPFNFVTNEVHYLDKRGAERAIIPGTLNKVIFMQETDSTTIATIFRANIPNIDRKATCKTCLVEELNEGKIKLVKIARRVLKSKDSLFNTIRKHYFEDVAECFIQNGEFYQWVTKLNKEAVFAFIPGASTYNDWVKEKGLRFDKEEDYLTFFNQYNSTSKK